MYSSEDFENFYVRYKAEALPKGISIQSWCMKNKVSWNLFNKWYRDTRHRIVPVDVEGRPMEEEILKKDSETLESTSPCAEPVTSSNDPVRIMIDIRMSNGMQIRQKNLDFGRLKKLVENLEGLC
jgi:hypothetical protein